MVLDVHEWALADSVLTTALNYANGKKIKKIVVVVGELQQIELEIFKLALEELKKLYNVEAEIVIEEEEAIFKCNSCGYEWSFRDTLDKLDEATKESIHFIPELSHSFIRCPRCGSPDYEIVKGRGVYIKEIEVEKR